VNYREALAWLYATQQFGIKLGLENTERLLRTLRILEGRAPRDHIPGSARGPRAAFGGPPNASSSRRIIHVAGTNGKGSVCAMIDSICRAAGYRTGLFTSPHLISFRERIRVNGEMISEEDVARGLTEIHDLIRDWDAHPTFFEITTALALRHFQNVQCEIIVLETGMGGRLDATNAITADLSVITPIDFDHQKWLGHSIAEIAAEKAGIIKPGVPVISAAQPAEAARVIEQRAEECAAPLQFVIEPWTRLPVSLRGEFQKMNAALAVAAVRKLKVPDEAISTGLLSVEWPARFQIWDEHIVIDGAHNPAGARALVQTWREEFGDQRATIIFAVLRDKNIAGMLAELSAIAAQFILPPVRTVRAVPPSEIAALLSSIAPSLPCSIAPSVADALSSAQKQSDHVLFTGSLHFAGEVLAILRGEGDLLEDCAQ
jgi:dihydrofolate synthase/folylpolyglutamate synthase